MKEKYVDGLAIDKKDNVVNRLLLSIAYVICMQINVMLKPNITEKSWRRWRKMEL
ncbi:914_t:CDS:2 [Acaulospora colombiana]|uniref:914_t:CDS:1 n=1 Tax=Acaulospora colombiana TaxID=27376 RepID=A0ACA9LGV7_9GLOM|nr:914_t:CDS:2 [Acaulospora colombiana]